MTPKKIRPFAFWRTLPQEKKCLAPNEVFLNSNWSVFFCEGHGIKCYKCVSEKSWDDCVPGNDTTCLNSTGSCLQLNLMEKFQILEVTGFFKKSVPWNRYVTTTFARDTDRGLSSESVISNAAKVTCAIETYWIAAMEPKYQLSVVFCFWSALLSFFYCWNWRKFSVRLKKTGNTFRKWLLLRVL